MRRFLMVLAVTGALAASPALAAAQPAPPPGGALLQPTVMMSQSPEFAAVRARFEGMTPAQLAAAGYLIAPECVQVPQLGAMGFHAVNGRLLEAEFSSGQVDAANPPIVLVGANNRVIGIEWEVDQRVQPAPVLFGQTLVIQPGHPHLEQPHYMFHAYFKPNGQVLFSTFDPQGTCPAPGVARDGQSLQSQSAQTQQRFQAVWGVGAAERWALEHNMELTRLGQ